VNCAECQLEPLTPGHYCPCCGRKLSLQERRAMETAPPVAVESAPAAPSPVAPTQAASSPVAPVQVAPNSVAPDPVKTPVPRCQSCGGPSPDGDLCQSCQKAFAPVLAGPAATVPNGSSVPTDAKSASRSPSPETIVKTTVETLPAPAARTQLAKTPPAVLPNNRLVVSVHSPRRARMTALAVGTLAIVAAIGAFEGVRRFRQPTGIAREDQPAEAPAIAKATATTAEHAPPPSPSSAADASTDSRTTAPPQAAEAARPKPAPSARQREAARQPSSADHQAVPVVTPVAEIEAPAPVVAPQPAAPAAAELPAPRSAPSGKIFERSDVDESPQIATRVEPQFPADIQAHAHNDIVVVRVLVSQSGHPFRVSLLRGSKAGHSSDDAVVAAVTKWTFSPAKKRGEAVSCWYNIGVPIGRAN
jgi:periplasmic protein TonB